MHIFLKKICIFIQRNFLITPDSKGVEQIKIDPLRGNIMCPKYGSSENYPWENDLEKANEIDDAFITEATKQIREDFDAVEGLSPIAKNKAREAAIKRMKELANAKLKKVEQAPVIEQPSGKIPPPPKPPEGIPQPPKPPQEMGGPPPPPDLSQMGRTPKTGKSKTQASKAKVPDKMLSEFTMDERHAWVDTLKLGGFFPKDISIYGPAKVPSTKGGKAIPEGEKSRKNPTDSPTEAERLTSVLQTQVKASLDEIYNLAESSPKEAVELVKLIDSKMKSWKNGVDGLVQAHKTLGEEISKLKQKIDLEKEKQHLAKSHDETYETIENIAHPIRQEYEKQLQIFQTATEYEEKKQAYEKMKTCVEDLKAKASSLSRGPKALIKDMSGAFAEASRKYESAKNGPALRVQKLTTEIEKHNQTIADADNKLKRGFISDKKKKELQGIISKAKQDITVLEEEIKNPGSEIVSAQQHNISIEKDNYDKKRAAHIRNVALHSLLEPPPSWSDVFSQMSKLERAQEKKDEVKVKEGEGSKKGMEKTVGAGSAGAAQREFDIQFLSPLQLARLAEFFTHDKEEFAIIDKESTIELMKHINLVLARNPAFDFDMIIDIADGRIERKEGVKAPEQIDKVFDPSTIQKAEGTTPPQVYEAALKRSENFKDAKYNADRGITYQKKPGSKTYYEYTRKINLDYFKEDEIRRLASFFAPSDVNYVGENNLIDREALKGRIDNLLNTVNLTFEDIAEIAAGHVKREGAAPQNDFYVMTEKVSRTSPPSNLYESFIQQRKDYIEQKKREEEEKKRLEEEKKERERVAAEQEKEKQLREAQEQYSQEASELLEQYKGDFKEHYKELLGISDFELNLSKEGQFKMFEEFVNAKIADKAPDLKSVILEKMKSMDPRSFKEAEKKEVDSTLETGKPSSSIDDEKGTVSEDVPEAPETLTTEEVKTPTPYVTPNSPKTSLASDPYALKIIRDVLKRIDVQQNYELATREKRGLKGTLTARYKVFQHGDRPQQIVSLQKTIIKAQEDIDALIKLYARAQVNPDEAKNAMARIFDGLERTMQDIEEQMETSGHKKKGTSRMENVIKDLRVQFDELQTGLGLEVKKSAPKIEESTKKRSSKNE